MAGQGPAWDGEGILYGSFAVASSANKSLWHLNSSSEWIKEWTGGDGAGHRRFRILRKRAVYFFWLEFHFLGWIKHIEVLGVDCWMIYYWPVRLAINDTFSFWTLAQDCLLMTVKWQRRHTRHKARALAYKFKDDLLFPRTLNIRTFPISP